MSDKVISIKQAFEKRHRNGQKCFIPFFTAGDPSIVKTEEFILALSKAGADIIEIGVPFSDPAADGKVIMAANIRAMSQNVYINEVLDILKRLKGRVDSSLVFLIYANIIFKYGIDRFFEKCSDVGISGVIIPDVPIEEEGEFRPFADKFNIDLIRLISPMSLKRTEKICYNASGFLYCVSSMGVTGVRKDVNSHLEEMFSVINKYKKIPTAIGFGISTPTQAKQVCKYADGVIIGSAIVKIIEEYGENASAKLFEYAQQIRQAIDSSDTP